MKTISPRGIWSTLQLPVFSLAPMEDVTDTVFRRIILKTGKPDVFFTEFTNVEGMFSVGEKLVSQRLLFMPEEKPLIAQIWGLKPENFYKAAQKLKSMGFDGIDINMGCPQKSVTQKGACSALVNNHSLAKEIIMATQEGAGDLPVSVKTRIGFKTNVLEEWLGFLLDLNLDVLTVHGRTAAEMSAVPAHWDEIKKAVEIRNQKGCKTLILGNGDVKSLKEAKEKVGEYGVDGVMIGRGIFDNPWLFNDSVDVETISVHDRMDLALEHLNLYETTWKGKKPFDIMKKYLKIYLSHFDGANAMRQEIMESESIEEVRGKLYKIRENKNWVNKAV